MDFEIKCLWDAKARLGEGPLWMNIEGALYWIDIQAPAIHRLNPQTGRKSTWPMPEKIGCLVYDEMNGFRAAIKTGFVGLEFGAEGDPPKITNIIDPETDMPNNRFNDGKLDSEGRFWAGTMDDLERETTGSWWRLGPDDKIRKMDTGYKVTNGPAFDVDRRLIYLTDSAAQTIYVANYLSFGEITNKRVFKTFGDGEGFPDGMTTDLDGNLWVAFWDGGCIRKISPHGEVLKTIQMPVPRPTSVTFDEKYERLFVTSARTGLSEDQLAKAPLSGGVFELRLANTPGRRRDKKAKKSTPEVHINPTSRDDNSGPERLTSADLAIWGMGGITRHPLIALIFTLGIVLLALAPFFVSALRPYQYFLWGVAALAGIAGLIALSMSILNSFGGRIRDHEARLRNALKQEILEEMSNTSKATEVRRKRAGVAFQALRDEIRDIGNKEVLSAAEIKTLKSQLDNQVTDTRALEERISHRLNATHGRIYAESQKMLRDLQALKSGNDGKSATKITELENALNQQRMDMQVLEAQMSKRFKLTHGRIYDQGKTFEGQLENMQVALDKTKGEIDDVSQNFDKRLKAVHGRIYDEKTRLENEIQDLANAQDALQSSSTSAIRNVLDALEREKSDTQQLVQSTNRDLEALKKLARDLQDKIESQSKQNSTSFSQGLEQVETRLLKKLKDTEITVEKAMNKFSENDKKINELGLENSQTRTAVKAEMANVFGQMNELNAMVVATKASLDGLKQTYNVQASAPESPSNALTATQLALQDMSGKLEKLLSRSDGEFAQSVPKAPINRTFSDKHIKVFQDKWQPFVETIGGENAVEYLADRILQIEKLSKLPLTHSIEDAVLHAILAGNLSKARANILVFADGMEWASIYEQAGRHCQDIEMTVSTANLMSPTTYGSVMDIVGANEKSIHFRARPDTIVELSTHLKPKRSKYDFILAPSDIQAETFKAWTKRGSLIVLQNLVNDLSAFQNAVAGNLLGQNWNTIVLKRK